MLKSLFTPIGAALIVLLSGALGHPASADPQAAAPQEAPVQAAPAQATSSPADNGPPLEGSKTVHLVSLFWPPYVGKELPFGGIDTDLISQTLAEEGLSLKVDFVPWPRALAMFESGTIDGIYPEYPERGDKHTHCAMSNAYRTTVLSIAEPVGKPLQWNEVHDLARYRLGIVRGYLNTPEFDSLVANGIITAEIEPTDVINLRKVAAQRIDGALIDPEVYRYLIESDVSLQPLRDMIKLNPQPLADRTLHICFHDDARGRTLRRIFHAGLEQRGLGQPEKSDPQLPQQTTPE
jgi:polar amino acid transport system substrate-binding protein